MNCFRIKNEFTDEYKPNANYDKVIDSFEEFNPFIKPELNIKSVAIDESTYDGINSNCISKDLKIIAKECYKNYSHLLFSRYMDEKFCLYRLGFPKIYNPNEFIEFYELGLQSHKHVNRSLCYWFLFL